MTPTGKPIRFLLVVLLGWVALRAAMLWPAPAPISGLRPTVAVRAPTVPTEQGRHTIVRAPVQPKSEVLAPAPRFAALVPKKPRRDFNRIAPAILGLVQFGPVQVMPDHGEIRSFGDQTLSRIPPASPAVTSDRRWQASAWLLLRAGSGPQGALTGGLLGASQAGARIGYAIDDAHRLSLFGRVSTALATPGAEAALGIDWQPTRLPVRLIAEERLPIGAAYGGPTLGVVGGIGPVPVLGRIELESYAQAGVIVRDGGIGFVDGLARLHHPLAVISGVHLSAGAGLSGGAQPGAARLDVGPVIIVDVPVRRHALRFSLEWRQRVAGGAAPGAGPALTIGADF